MELVVDVAEAFVGYVGVDLGGGDVFVAEELLHGAKVNALGHQIGGVRMAQGVGRGKQRNAGQHGVAFYNPFN